MQKLISYAPLVSPILIILGWIIVNAQNNHRETRKELRSILDAIDKRLEIIVEDAISFHTSHTWNGIEAQKITSKIERAISTINHAAKIIDIDCHVENKNLRQSITLKNFDKTSHTALSETDYQILEIYDSSYLIMSKLENGFMNKYLNSFFTISIIKQLRW